MYWNTDFYGDLFVNFLKYVKNLRLDNKSFPFLVKSIVMVNCSTQFRWPESTQTQKLSLIWKWKMDLRRLYLVSTLSFQPTTSLRKKKLRDEWKRTSIHQVQSLSLGFQATGRKIRRFSVKSTMETWKSLPATWTTFGLSLEGKWARMWRYHIFF